MSFKNNEKCLKINRRSDEIFTKNQKISLKMKRNSTFCQGINQEFDQIDLEICENNYANYISKYRSDVLLSDSRLKAKFHPNDITFSRISCNVLQI